MIKNNSYVYIKILIILYILFFPTNDVLFSQCKEGYGSFIVFKSSSILNKADDIIIHPKNFKNLYLDLISYTFPVNIELPPNDYNPDKDDTFNLFLRFKKTKFGLIFVPRTLYDLLYFYYYHTIRPKNYSYDTIDDDVNEITSKHSGDQSSEISKISKISEIKDAYKKKINQSSIKYALEMMPFNNWVLEQLWGLKDFKDKFGSKNTIYLEKENIDLLLDKYSKSFSTKLKSIFKQAISAECQVRNLFILYRANDKGRSANNSPLITKLNEPDLNSVSYNHSLFSGFVNDNDKEHGACTKELMNENIKSGKKIYGFMLLINKSLHKNKDKPQSLYYIPPIPTIMSYYMMGEYWHPRTIVMAWNGINMNKLVHGIGGHCPDPADENKDSYQTCINNLPLWLRRNELTLEDVKKIVEFHDSYLQSISINFPSED